MAESCSPRPDLVSSFWSRVDQRGPDECWPWRGALKRGGYGHTYIRRNNGRGVFTGAHRAAYELVKGSIPEGLVIDHLCRNRACVNPDHLEPVTCQENLLRSPLGAGEKARRTHCPKGHPYTEANTYVSPRNQRNCRTCKRIREGTPVPKCFLCHREEPILDGTYTRVDFRGAVGIQLICDDCSEKADRPEIVVEDHGAYVLTIDRGDD